MTAFIFNKVAQRFALLRCIRTPQCQTRVLFSSEAKASLNGKNGLIVGVYEDEIEESKAELTKVGQIVDKRNNGKLSENLSLNTPLLQLSALVRNI